LRYFCIGMFMTSAGQWIQQVTLGWLVYELTPLFGIAGLAERATRPALPGHRAGRGVNSPLTA
jgi:hypothetical protein